MCQLRVNHLIGSVSMRHDLVMSHGRMLWDGAGSGRPGPKVGRCVGLNG
jgi:hypothetical protein